MPQVAEREAQARVGVHAGPSRAPCHVSTSRQVGKSGPNGPGHTARPGPGCVLGGQLGIFMREET